MSTPEEEGLRSALRISKISLHRERLARFRTNRELASLRMEMEEALLWFAEKRSEGKDVPSGLNRRALEEWINGR